MDLEGQNRFAVKLEDFLKKWLSDKPFHVIVSVEGSAEKGFSFSVTNLNKYTPFQSCDIVISGVSEESRALVNKFEIPSYAKSNKPFELK